MQVNFIVAPWDVDKDGLVNVLDLIIVAQSLGNTIVNPTFPNPDVNQDGVVNMDDLILIAQNFGEVYNVRDIPAGYSSSQYHLLPDPVSDDSAVVGWQE